VNGVFEADHANATGLISHFNENAYFTLGQTKKLT
jgi:hypothetical protein